MNILIVAAHYAVCSARYAADAFSRLGHTVKHIGPEMGRNIWGMQIPEEYVWEPNAPYAFDQQFPPDIIVVMDSDPAILAMPYLETFLWAWGSQKPPVVVWGVDNHVRDYRRPYFDHYFLAHRSVSVMEWQYEVTEDAGDTVYRDLLDYEDMTWLPCGFDNVAFPPSPIAWDKREFDVCMIGVLYPKRWELVNAMRAAGLKVLAGTGLIYEAYRDAHWNSRVALVSSFNGDLPIRAFEGLGMGCAVMCDPIADLPLLAREQSDMLPFLVYGDVEQAVKMAVEIQHRPNFDYDKWLAHNVQWAAAHTWERRAQVIVDWLEARK